jgi:hypothetical protein
VAKPCSLMIYLGYGNGDSGGPRARRVSCSADADQWRRLEPFLSVGESCLGNTTRHLLIWLGHDGNRGSLGRKNSGAIETLMREGRLA